MGVLLSLAVLVEGIYQPRFSSSGSKVARLVWSQQQKQSWDTGYVSLGSVSATALLPVSGLAEMFVATAFPGGFVMQKGSSYVSCLWTTHLQADFLRICNIFFLSPIPLCSAVLWQYGDFFEYGFKDTYLVTMNK